MILYSWEKLFQKLEFYFNKFLPSAISYVIMLSTFSTSPSHLVYSASIPSGVTRSAAPSITISTPLQVFPEQWFPLDHQICHINSFSTISTISIPISDIIRTTYQSDQQLLQSSIKPLLSPALQSQQISRSTALSDTTKTTTFISLTPLFSIAHLD